MRWLWWFSLIAAATLLFNSTQGDQGFVAALTNFFGIFTPFIIAFVIAFLLYAPCNLLEKWIKKGKGRFWQKAARPISITVCFLALLALLAGIVGLLLPELYAACVGLVRNLPVYYAKATAWMNAAMADGGLLSRFNLVDTVRGVYDEVYNWIMSLANTDMLVSAFKGVISVTASLFDIIMGFIIAVYMLSERESLLGAVKALAGAVFGEKAEKTFAIYAHKTAAIFYNYLYGAFVDAVVVAAILSVGFLLFGLPKAILLGCLIGILNFVPYFGAIIGGCIAVVVALFSGNIYTAIGVLVYVVVMQQLDGNILQPKIVGSTVGMRPIYVLLAITVGGGIFGLGGILIGVPVLAVIKMLLADFIAYRKKKVQIQTEE